MNVKVVTNNALNERQSYVKACIKRPAKLRQTVHQMSIKVTSSCASSNLHQTMSKSVVGTNTTYTTITDQGKSMLQSKMEKEDFSMTPLFR